MKDETRRARRMRSLSPPLRGEGRGEGCFHKHMTRGETPSPRPSPPKQGEREKKEAGGEGARAVCVGAHALECNGPPRDGRVFMRASRKQNCCGHDDIT